MAAARKKKASIHVPSVQGTIVASIWRCAWKRLGDMYASVPSELLCAVMCDFAESSRGRERRATRVLFRASRVSSSIVCDSDSGSECEEVVKVMV